MINRRAGAIGTRAPRSRRASPPEFLAVDFDLRSRLDPAPFVAALGPGMGSQAVGKDRGRHWVHVMHVRSFRTPSEAILAFSRTFDRLPQKAKRVFDRAHKEFDIGFEAGSNVARAGEWVLSKRALEAAARLGATIRVTVYEASELVEARQRPVRRK